ncbi:MAG TPA: hypothetical protein VGL72_05045 [Bryobacteraceae bacterium]|jgi:hypothetical protein
MTPTSLARHAARFRSAVEARDFRAAQAALDDYVAHFRSRGRSLKEVDDARNLLAWGLQQTHAHKAQIAEELMLLKTLVDAYARPVSPHTWRVEG